MKTKFNIKSKQGFTLIELLTVIAVTGILLTLTIGTLSSVDKFSKSSADASKISIYNKAFEDFRFNDYSSLSTVNQKDVVVISNGTVKINAYINLSTGDIEALCNSGRGMYPQTKAQCVATIRAYTGNNDIIRMPASGMAYSFFYNKNTGKCGVYKIADEAVKDTNIWINLNEYYDIITNYKLGDVNLDGTVNISDVNLLRNNLADSIQLNAYQKECCDINRDGKIGIGDLTILLKYVNGSSKDKLEW